MSDAVESRLQLALEASADAARFIGERFRAADLRVDRKSDATPVTEADRGAELMLRKAIEQAFPDDGIVGEEFGERASKNGIVWILDPIDGTKSFIHGVPLFGTLIGIQENDQLVAGLCRFPALDEVVYAARGYGAFQQRGAGEPTPARVSQTERLADATFCTTTITGWKSAGRQAAFDALCEACGLVRAWGDCYGHILVATGRADVMIDPALNPWDAAALVPIVEEAGGAFLSLDGKPTIHGGNGMSVNAALQPHVLEVLRTYPPRAT